MVISPVLEYGWNKYTWQNLSIGSPTCGVRVIMGGGGIAKGKPLEILPPKKMVNRRDTLGIPEISATTKDLKDAGVGILTLFPFNASVRLVQSTDGAGGMLMDYCKLNQVVTLIATALPMWLHC